MQTERIRPKGGRIESMELDYSEIIELPETMQEVECLYKEADIIALCRRDIKVRALNRIRRLMYADLGLFE